jgi:hypothetical protein
MDRKARTLVHTLWFDFALQRLGGARRMDEMLRRELYRLALFADLVPEIPRHEPLRIYRTLPFVHDDGQLTRLWIYFRLTENDAVELLHIEAVDEEMRAA